MKSATTVMALVLCIGGCTSSSDGASNQSTALAGDRDDCLSAELGFGGELYVDLQKTISPSSDTDADAFTITIPRSLTAEGWPHGSPETTTVDTVLAFTTFLGNDAVTGEQKNFVRIGGEFPDDLGGDTAATRLFDAMDVPDIGSPGNKRKVSKDGLFECSQEEWKGGVSKTCTFSNLRNARVISYGPSHLCAPKQ